MVSYKEVFPKRKSIIGMLHLAGSDSEEILRRAREELKIFAGEGLDGAIVENYHGSLGDVQRFLDVNDNKDITLGLNLLGFNFLGLEWAQRYDVRFVQLDNVNGFVRDTVQAYMKLREKTPNAVVLGGVRFKYQKPTRNSLKDDIFEGSTLSDAIVTTGEGTGIETPLSKLRDFRAVMKDYPLIVGAGVDARNVREQLEICDGAIVGSYFKNGNTRAPVDVNRVRELMNIVRSFN